MSLKRCYELINSQAKVIRITEDSAGLLIAFYDNSKLSELFLTSTEIDELLKSIDMLRPERPVVKKEMPRGGGK